MELSGLDDENPSCVDISIDIEGCDDNVERVPSWLNTFEAETLWTTSSSTEAIQE